MSSKDHNEDSDTHSSGYEGDVSDQVSDNSTLVVPESISSSKPTVAKNNEHNEPETGVITIGCDTRDAGPGIRSDDDARFGTILIGCAVCEMAERNRQTFVTSDSECEVEHIEGIGALADEEYFETGSNDSAKKDLRACDPAQ